MLPKDLATKYESPGTVKLIWKNGKIWDVRDQNGRNVPRIIRISISQIGNETPEVRLTRQYFEVTITNQDYTSVEYEQTCLLESTEVI